LIKVVQFLPSWTVLAKLSHFRYLLFNPATSH
jgi:hypothetical protein